MRRWGIKKKYFEKIDWTIKFDICLLMEKAKEKLKQDGAITDFKISRTDFASVEDWLEYLERIN